MSRICIVNVKWITFQENKDLGADNGLIGQLADNGYNF
jgi:hypothetical protein